MRRSSRRKKRVNYSEDSLFERMLRRQGRTTQEWYTTTEQKAPPKPVRAAPGWFAGPVAAPVAPDVAKPKPKPKPPKKKRLKEKRPKPPLPKKKRRDDPVPRSVGEWEDRGKKGWSEALPGLVSAQARADAIAAPGPPPKRNQFMSRHRRHLLFMNPGAQSIRAAIVYLQQGGTAPGWVQFFPEGVLEVRGNRLYFEGLRMLLPEEKRDAVKHMYFTPDEPSTIEPIWDKLAKTYANVKKSAVQRILRSLETYQLNFRRRHPAKILNRTLFSKPGVIAIDTFYPSKKWGWDTTSGYSVLCCIDCFSRFSRAYACVDKKSATIGKALKKFLVEFAGLGHLPRRILSDPGTELAHARRLMEVYRQPRDGDQPMVIHSFSGAPVMVVEGQNALYQRRMQVFRTSNLTDSPAAILTAISDQLNNQKVRVKGNKTPLELLRLSTAERTALNEKYGETILQPPDGAQRALEVDDHVRILLMTRKEQIKPEAHQKGFAPKWSREVYSVLRRTALRRNPGVFKYHVGTHQSYYRHELLKIPKVVDKVVIDTGWDRTENIEGDYDPDSDYEP